MAEPRVMKCPICGVAFFANRSQALPFCSARCKQIDLGRWLGENYALPVERDNEEEGDEPGDD